MIKKCLFNKWVCIICVWDISWLSQSNKDQTDEKKIIMVECDLNLIITKTEMLFFELTFLMAAETVNFT